MLHKIYFDADSTNGVTPPAQQTTDPNAQPVKQPKYTDDDVNNIVAKRVGEALKKFETTSAQKQKEIEEADKLKNMTEEQKRVAEFQKLKEELSSFKRGQFAAEYKAQMVEKGLPGNLSQVLPVEDAEKAKMVIDELEKFKSDIIAAKDKEIADLRAKITNTEMRGTPPKAAGAVATPTGTQLRTIY